MSSDQPLVSVIMPVYNAASKMERAAKSVLEQGYQNVELVLVDDGSTDDSPRIARQLAASDLRIKFVSQLNEGVSSARNKGLKHATGSYITFLDADDWFAEGALAQMVAVLLQDQSDMVRFNNYIFQNTGVYPRKTSYRGQQILHSRDQLDALITSLEIGKEPGYVWLMLIRAELARSVSFQEGIAVYEDLLYTVEILKNASHVILTDKPLMYYDQTGTSATRNNAQAVKIIHKILQGEGAVLEKLMQLHSSEPQNLYFVIERGLSILSRSLAGSLIRGSISLNELEGALKVFSEYPSVQAATRFVQHRKPLSKWYALPTIRLEQDSATNAKAIYDSRHVSQFHSRARALTKSDLRTVVKKIQGYLRPIKEQDSALDTQVLTGTQYRVWVQTMRQVTKNYGCLLQATALQRVLRDLNCIPITNAVAVPTWSWRTLPNYMLQLLHSRSFASISTITLQRDPYVELANFARTNLKVTNRNFGSRRRRWPKKYHGANFAIVGSDQVWRPKYIDVLWGVFNYLPVASPKRVAYAASFGVSNLDEFTPDLKDAFGQDLRRFHAISVREQSGVQLCLEGWGIHATHALDPTLLLKKSDWLAYIEGQAPSSLPRYLAYMTLDEDAVLLEAARHLANKHHLRLVKFYPPQTTSHKEYIQNPDKYRLPPVSEWLQLINCAELVITDSFHVSVFSVLFETPFYTIKNESRGATRFESLGQTLGLESAFVTKDEFLSADLIPTPDWHQVGKRLADERERSLEFLRNALS